MRNWLFGLIGVILVTLITSCIGCSSSDTKSHDKEIADKAAADARKADKAEADAKLIAEQTETIKKQNEKFSNAPPADPVRAMEMDAISKAAAHPNGSRVYVPQANILFCTGEAATEESKNKGEEIRTLGQLELEKLRLEWRERLENSQFSREQESAKKKLEAAQVREKELGAQIKAKETALNARVIPPPPAISINNDGIKIELAKVLAAQQAAANEIAKLRQAQSASQTATQTVAPSCQYNCKMRW